MTWKTLGAAFPGELTEARLQLHWAAQLVSAPGTSLLPAEADDSHTNLGWDAKLGVLAGRNVGAESVQAALVFEALELLVIDAGRERSSMRLAGHTLQQALAWLGEEIAGDASALSLPVYEMPSAAVGEGGVFSDAGTEARTELAAWFANAFPLIREVVAADPAASPVRCWPHHFDVASLITLDAGCGLRGGAKHRCRFFAGRWFLRPAVLLRHSLAVSRHGGSSPARRWRALAPRRMDWSGAHCRTLDLRAARRAAAHGPRGTRPSGGSVS